MSKCTVAVTVDGWEAMGDVAPTYHIGSPITGTVHVWVSAAVRCDGLDVQLVPVRSSQGYFLGLDLQTVRLFEGKWEPGEYEYRFSIPSPWLPTHAGKHVAWKWVARATADIPWAIDPKGESEVRVVFAEPPTELEVTPPAETGEGSAAESGESKLQLPLTGVFLLSLIAIAAGGLGMFLEIASEELTGALTGVGVTVCILSLMLLGATSRGRAARGETTTRSLERVGLTHRRGGGDYRSGGGSFIDCDVKASSKVASMSARLVVQEYMEWTTRRNETTTTHRREHLIHQQDVELAQDAATGSWRGSLAVPETTAVPCFSIGKPPGHGVVWKVELLSTQAGKREPEITRRLLQVRPRMS